MTIHTSNLPALVDALGYAPQPGQWTEFDRPRQVAFLEALATGGSVRAAARAADVSSQTVYRVRRSDAGFRLAWQGALLAARARAEDTLACRAIDGIEQEVLYHGEVVATRRRYSDRLLLAHLERLDRLTAIPRINAFAEDFEDALARFAAGEPQPEPGARRAPGAGAWTGAGAGDGAGAGAGDGNFSSGECHNRSMSYTGHDHPDADGEDDCAHWAALDEDDGDHRDTEEVDAAIRALMERKRPAGAATPSELAGRYTAEEIAAVQQAAFEDFHQEWWLVIPPAPPGGSWAWCHLEPARAGDAARARARARARSRGEPLAAPWLDRR